MIKLRNYLLAALFSICLLLSVCVKDTEQVEKSAVESETVHNTDAVYPEEEPKTDYGEYIPIYINKEETNLYEAAFLDSIIYMKKNDCDDCAREEDYILDTIKESGINYLEIEVTKDPLRSDRPAIASKVAKGLGLTKVPSVCFLKDGVFVGMLDNGFSDEDRLKEMIREMYG